MALAPLADLLFQTVTYDALLASIEPQSAWEFSGEIARNLRQLPGLVEQA
ncbi:hypothetical protein [Agrococcus sp. Ld7]